MPAAAFAAGDGIGTRQVAADAVRLRERGCATDGEEAQQEKRNERERER